MYFETGGSDINHYNMVMFGKLSMYLIESVNRPK